MDHLAWDARYTGRELVWSAEPNRFLVAEVDGLAPGRALDLACGEGRNAIWLAEQGWTVTGVDFSAVGLDKARRLAEARQVSVQWERADVTEYEPPADGFDLVIVMYLHLPAPARRRALGLASGGVAPGGHCSLSATTSRTPTRVGVARPTPACSTDPKPSSTTSTGSRSSRPNGSDGPSRPMKARRRRSTCSYARSDLVRTADDGQPFPARDAHDAGARRHDLWLVAAALGVVVAAASVQRLNDPHPTEVEVTQLRPTVGTGGRAAVARHRPARRVVNMNGHGPGAEHVEREAVIGDRLESRRAVDEPVITGEPEQTCQCALCQSGARYGCPCEMSAASIVEESSRRVSGSATYSTRVLREPRSVAGRVERAVVELRVVRGVELALPARASASCGAR